MIKASYILEILESIVRLDERNVLNIKDIDEFLKEVEKSGEWSKESIKWLQKRVRLYLINDYPHLLNRYFDLAGVPNPPLWMQQAIERGEEVDDIDLRPHRYKELLDQVILIMQALNSSDAPKRIDALSYDQARSLSLKWYETQLKQSIEKKDLEDIKTVKEYGGGVRWVRLLTKLSLGREGDEMHHCLNGDSFNSSSSVRYYSLRDSRNKPHATIEVEGRFISQIKGYDNGPVEDKYIEICRDFINTYLKPTGIEDIDLVNIFSYCSSNGKVKEGISVDQVANMLTSGYAKPSLEKAIKWLERRIDEKAYYGELDISMPLIFIAIHRADIFAVNICVKYGADLKSYDSVELYGKWLDLTPLMYACLISADDNLDLRKGYREIILDLIPKSNLEQEDLYHGQTPLFMVLPYELNDVYELMLKKGADPNAEDSYGNTPLTTEIDNGASERVAMLIQYGAKVEEMHLQRAEDNGWGEVAAMLAKVLGQTDYEYEGD